MWLKGAFAVYSLYWTAGTPRNGLSV